MKSYRTEGAIEYNQYRFGYCNWMDLQDSVDPEPAYTGGYLPYSGEATDPRHLFYMARSLRVDLSRSGMDKKRRYDHRSWCAFNLQRVPMEKSTFLERYGDQAIERAQEWMAPRFGEKALPRERLVYILSKPFLTDILTWTLKDVLVAFALVARGTWGAHYWYVFYQNGNGIVTAPGHGYLVDFIEWARDAALPHAYIGTAYGLKSRYKSRGLKGIEFWDGNEWNPDREELKRRQNGDAPAD